MNQLKIIKIGGKVIDDQAALDAFLTDFSKIMGSKVLVHGGGKIASGFGEKLGIKPNYFDGRRITDAQTLELVTMVYGGLINKKIVAQLQVKGVNALGLTGADANVIAAKRRPVKEIDYGYVGDVSEDLVNFDSLSMFLEAGLTPVLCPLTHDGLGSLLNTNADTIASVLSSGLSRIFDVELIYCFEQKGVLSDFENQTVIPQINPLSYEELKIKGTIKEGMIPKLDNAFDALSSGVSTVTIGHFSDVLKLANGKGSGTVITL
ncbi:MAG: acetylglutamate kinase [Roseivirga sp.]|nr:acetylglutamate kinase [Roseivirga sp.]